MNLSWETPLIPVIDSALEGDIEEILRLVTDLINQKIDIPGIKEEVELIMFDGFTCLRLQRWLGSWTEKGLPEKLYRNPYLWETFKGAKEY